MAPRDSVQYSISSRRSSRIAWPITAATPELATWVRPSSTVGSASWSITASSFWRTELSEPPASIGRRSPMNSRAQRSALASRGESRAGRAKLSP